MKSLPTEFLASWGTSGSSGLTGLNVEKILATALRRGGALAELFFEKTHTSELRYEGNRVDRVVLGSDSGVGLRIILDGRSIYGYTTNLTEASLLTLAYRLSEGIPDSPAKEKKRMALVDWRKAESEVHFESIQIPPSSVPIEKKLETLKEADQAAREVLPNAAQVGVACYDSFRELLIFNSDGLICQDSKTYLQFVVQVVGVSGTRKESAAMSDGGWVGWEFFEENPARSFGVRAAQRVQILLEAKPAPSGTMPVVISSEAGGTLVHEAVGHGLEADYACRGLSVYEGKLEKQVASPLVTVIDDGSMVRKRGSFTFDDEGNPSKKTVLIENGVLKGYLVDRISAMKFDLVATGNGRRESFRSPPLVRMTNTYIAPGSEDPSSILEQTDHGLFVKAMGGGEVNTVTGDFVFAVTEGYLIEKGKLTHAIRGATLVGNGPKVLSLVDHVGSDLHFSTGTCMKQGQDAPVTCAQPTLRVPEMTVGGEVPLSTYWKI